MANKAIPEMSVDTRLLYQRISQMKHDEVISYDDLTALIGRDVRGRARSNLNAARNKAMRENQVVTEVIINEGIKRLSDNAIVEHTGDSARRRIRRASSRAMRKLASVAFDRLTNAHKIKHNAEMSQIGALQAISKDAINARLKSKIAKTATNGALSIAHTLEAFKD